MTAEDEGVCTHRGSAGCNEMGYHLPHEEHRWGIRINGLRKCYGCDAEDYDSQWGAGLFSDWAPGHHKGYGE